MCKSCIKRKNVWKSYADKYLNFIFILEVNMLHLNMPNIFV